MFIGPTLIARFAKRNLAQSGNATKTTNSPADALARKHEYIKKCAAVVVARLKIDENLLGIYVTCGVCVCVCARTARRWSSADRLHRLHAAHHTKVNKSTFNRMRQRYLHALHTRLCARAPENRARQRLGTTDGPSVLRNGAPAACTLHHNSYIAARRIGLSKATLNSRLVENCADERALTMQAAIDVCSVEMVQQHRTITSSAIIAFGLCTSTSGSAHSIGHKFAWPINTGSAQRWGQHKL